MKAQKMTVLIAAIILVILMSVALVIFTQANAASEADGLQDVMELYLAQDAPESELHPVAEVNGMTITEEAIQYELADEKELNPVTTMTEADAAQAVATRLLVEQKVEELGLALTDAEKAQIRQNRMDNFLKSVEDAEDYAASAKVSVDELVDRWADMEIQMRTAVRYHGYVIEEYAAGNFQSDNQELMGCLERLCNIDPGNEEETANLQEFALHVIDLIEEDLFTQSNYVIYDEELLAQSELDVNEDDITDVSAPVESDEITADGNAPIANEEIITDESTPVVSDEAEME